MFRVSATKVVRFPCPQGTPDAAANPYEYEVGNQPIS